MPQITLKPAVSEKEITIRPALSEEDIELAHAALHNQLMKDNTMFFEDAEASAERVLDYLRNV